MVLSILEEDVLKIINTKGTHEYKLRKGQLESIKQINDHFLENFLFVAPTAYGKTLVAIHYIIKVLNAGLKVIYVAPLKALTNEIVIKLGNLGINVMEDTGDNRKKPDKDYKKCEVLISTYERMDVVLRNPNYHGVFEDFGLIIIDEVHSIHGESRGINLESLIVKVKYHTPLSILGMSATVDNYDTMSEFLNARCVYVPPEERPVKQNISIHYYMSGSYHLSISDRNEKLRIIFNKLIRNKKQALIFCSSRKRCESLAKEFSEIKERSPLELAKKSNYTWHHAGVPKYEKKEIEKMFLDNKVRFIFCTPTLAMGVNLPAYCVVIYDTCRWNGLLSKSVLIDSMEIEQMIGRAGRPQYGEKECEVHLFAREVDEPYKIRESYVDSKLYKRMKSVFNEWFCSGINEPEEVADCLYETFMSYQHDLKNDREVFGEEIAESLEFLIENKFVNKRNDGYYPSFLGKMTALFYIRPETALHFKKVEKICAESKRHISDLELTAMLLNNKEFLEMIRVDEKDNKLIDLCSSEFLDMKIPNELYNEKILKAMPMIFVNHFNEKYNKRIILYRTDANSLSRIIERIFSSAGVIIYNKKIKNRIADLKIMVKTKTLDRSIAVLKNTKSLGDTRMNRLLGVGIDNPEKFLSTSDTKLMNVMKVSKKVLTTIKDDLKLRTQEAN